VITGRELFNIHQVLGLVIRPDIRNPSNARVVRAILDELSDDGSLEKTGLNKRLSMIPGVDNALKVYIANTLVDASVDGTVGLKYLSVLVTALKEVEHLLVEGDFERAYDLVDAIHIMPEIIVRYGSLNRAYWKTHIGPYRDKWDKGFLVDEQWELRWVGFQRLLNWLAETLDVRGRGRDSG
jgi:hypothetical protein